MSKHLDLSVMHLSDSRSKYGEEKKQFALILPVGTPDKKMSTAQRLQRVKPALPHQKQTNKREGEPDEVARFIKKQVIKRYRSERG